MADTFTFDLVSPERRLASHEASAVEIPGADGMMTAMPDHAPTITSLRPGMLRVTNGGTTDEYVVSGGFAEISASTVSVLAERAVKREEMDQETFNAFIEEAKSRYKKVQEQSNEPGIVDDAAKLLADMVAMGDHIGLDSSAANL
ncbi:MAG: ATP synthase F1 subunit epsilon [Rhodobacterales bacterium]|nr:MAG: ATP synthase F1 subunit epsilon [Rhodobacterales bacterium]